MSARGAEREAKPLRVRRLTHEGQGGTYCLHCGISLVDLIGNEWYCPTLNAGGV